MGSKRPYVDAFVLRQISNGKKLNFLEVLKQLDGYDATPSSNGRSDGGGDGDGDGGGDDGDDGELHQNKKDAAPAHSTKVQGDDFDDDIYKIFRYTVGVPEGPKEIIPNVSMPTSRPAKACSKRPV